MKLKYGLPGRYAIRVRGNVLVRAGENFSRMEGQEREVLVDSFAPGVLGSNMDPAVLTERLPWFITYCNSKAWAANVTEGSILACGWCTTRLLMIDTVLVVSRRPVLPTLRDGRRWMFGLAEKYPEYRSQIDELRGVEWSEFVRSPEYRLNLADSEPSKHTRETAHHKAPFAPYLQLLGTLGNPDAQVSRDALTSRFLTGHGFDIIPRSSRRPAGRCKALDARLGMFAWDAPFSRRISKAVENDNVVPLADDEARGLLDALFDSEELVYGRLTPSESWPEFTSFGALRRLLTIRQLQIHGARECVVVAPSHHLKSRAEVLGNETGERIGGFTCGANSQLLARVARDVYPGASVALVGGLAFSDGGAAVKPAVHIWVRVNDQYFDITWSRYGSLDGCKYFAVREGDDHRQLMRATEDWAADHAIECAS